VSILAKGPILTREVATEKNRHPIPVLVTFAGVGMRTYVCKSQPRRGSLKRQELDHGNMSHGN